MLQSGLETILLVRVWITVPYIYYVKSPGWKPFPARPHLAPPLAVASQSGRSALRPITAASTRAGGQSGRCPTSTRWRHTNKRTNTQTEKSIAIAYSKVTVRKWFNEYFTCVCSACQRWISVIDTNVANGQGNPATTVTACEQACESNLQCNGFDWVTAAAQGQQCWLSGSWSGARNAGATGVIHYELNRNCQSQGNNIDGRNLQC